MFAWIAAWVTSIAKFTMLFAVWLFFVGGIIVYTRSFIGRYFARAVQIGTFADINDGSKDIASLLVSRADELTRPVSLDALYEVKVPPIANNFGAKEDQKFLEDVKLSFQGVDVPSVIRSFFSVLPDDHYVVSAKAANVGLSGPTLNMEFKSPSGDQQSWPLRIERPVTGAATPTAAATTSQVIDRAIYTMWYYMYYDPKGLRWRKDLDANFTDARALEAYYGGQQRLASYQRTFEPSHLDEAEKEFRLLTAEMPQFAPGQLFLGATLLEKRSERDAIRAFERAQQLLAPGKVLPTTATAADKKMWLQARYLVAVSRLQMYDWKENHEALRILEELLPDIPRATRAGETRHDLYDFYKIRFTVLAQIAHTVGHDLVLLNETTFVDALTDPPPVSPPVPLTVPATLRLPTQAEQDTLRAHAAALDAAITEDEKQTKRAQLKADFGASMTRIYAKQQELVHQAETFLDEIDTLVNAPTVADADQLNKEEWKRVKEKLVGDLQNAEGYALFRYAQVHDGSDEDFKTHCETARSKLLEALAVRPNEYTIIQNLALIYADPRFDPKGNEIETARALFARSLEIKQRDYYGYQQLVLLSIRQALEWGPQFVSLDTIKAALAQVEKAREFRPRDGETFTLLAQLYVLKWSKTSGTEQQEAGSMIEASLAAAARADDTDHIHLGVAKLQWEFAQLRATTSQAAFDEAKKKFRTCLKMAASQAKGSSLWAARRLVDRQPKLDDEIAALKFEARSTFPWVK